MTDEAGAKRTPPGSRGSDPSLAQPPRGGGDRPRPRALLLGRRKGKGRRGSEPPRGRGGTAGRVGPSPRDLRACPPPRRAATPRHAPRGTTNGKARGGRRRLLLAAAPAYIIGRRRRRRSAAGSGGGGSPTAGCWRGHLPARRWGGAGGSGDGGGEGPGAAEAERSGTGRRGGRRCPAGAERETGVSVAGSWGKADEPVWGPRRWARWRAGRGRSSAAGAAAPHGVDPWYRRARR